MFDEDYFAEVNELNTVPFKLANINLFGTKSFSYLFK
jgi:hypothetical protein